MQTINEHRGREAWFHLVQIPFEDAFTSEAEITKNNRVKSGQTNFPIKKSQFPTSSDVKPKIRRSRSDSLGSRAEVTSHRESTTSCLKMSFYRPVRISPENSVSNPSETLKISGAV